MAKIKLTRGKTAPTKRNVKSIINSVLIYLNSVVLIYLILKVHNVL